jgi:hypothetical protein
VSERSEIYVDIVALSRGLKAYQSLIFEFSQTIQSFEKKSKIKFFKNCQCLAHHPKITGPAKY